MKHSECETSEFQCERCGRRFRWTAALAGRRGRCKCGAVLQCPASSGEDLYELAPEPAPRAVLPGPAPVTLAYRVPKEEREAAAAAADPQKLKDLYMPLWLLGGGLAIEVANAFFVRVHWLVRDRRFEIAATHVAFELLLRTAFLVVGMLIAARLRGIRLGNFWTAVLKLLAIAVAPSALLSLIWPVFWLLPVIGELIGWVVCFCLYFALIGALFDLDEEDTWYCVVVIFLVRLGTYFSLAWALAV